MAAAVSSLSRLRVKGRARADSRGVGALNKRWSSAPAIRVLLSGRRRPMNSASPVMSIMMMRSLAQRAAA